MAGPPLRPLAVTRMWTSTRCRDAAQIAEQTVFTMRRVTV
jgi:hypothetical protein